MLAPILEGVGQVVADLLAHCPRDRDAASWGEGFEPRRNIHAVAIDVAVRIDNDVAEVDANAKDDPLVLEYPGVAVERGPLDLDRAGDRLHGARELDQGAVSGQLHNAPVMDLDEGLAEFASIGFEALKGACFIALHHAAVADHVACENYCRQPAL